MDHFFKNKYVLSTREYIDAVSDLKLFERKGLNCHISPGFKVKRLKVQVDYSFDGIIVTSKNSLEFLNELKINEKPIFCIGKSTSKKVISLGFKKNLIFSGEDIRGIEKKIKEYPKKNLTLLWLTQKNSENQIINNLRKHNSIIKKIICYEVIPLDYIDKRTISLINSNQVIVVLFYSIFSAKIWLKLIKDAKINSVVNKFNCVAISKEVSNYLLEHGFSDVYNAKRKNRFSLISKAIKVFKNKSI